MLSFAKYKGNHVGRTVMAVKCSNGEIIPLICDTAEEEIEYQKLCKLDIHDVRGLRCPIRACTSSSTCAMDRPTSRSRPQPNAPASSCAQSAASIAQRVRAQASCWGSAGFRGS